MSEAANGPQLTVSVPPLDWRPPAPELFQPPALLLNEARDEVRCPGGATTRKDAVFLKLKALLTPLGITHYYTDKAGVYQRHLPPEQHTVGKLTMQKIERKHLTLRTRLKRLVRKTLCFSRSYLMHDLLIGLYMNRVEFGCAV